MGELAILGKIYSGKLQFLCLFCAESDEITNKFA